VKKYRAGITAELKRQLIDHFGQFPYFQSINKTKPNFSNQNLTNVQDNFQLDGIKANSIFWISSYVECVGLEYSKSIRHLNNTKSEVKNLHRLKRANLNDECGFVLRLRERGKLISIPINELTLREQLLKVLDDYRNRHLEIWLRAEKSFSRFESKITSILCNLVFGFLQTVKTDLKSRGELIDAELYLLTGYILLCSNWRILENKLEDKQIGYPQHRKSSAIKFDSKFQKNLVDKVRNRVLSIKKNKAHQRQVSPVVATKVDRK